MSCILQDHKRVVLFCEAHAHSSATCGRVLGLAEFCGQGQAFFPVFLLCFRSTVNISMTCWSGGAELLGSDRRRSQRRACYAMPMDMPMPKHMPWHSTLASVQQVGLVIGENTMLAWSGLC